MSINYHPKNLLAKEPTIFGRDSKKYLQKVILLNFYKFRNGPSGIVYGSIIFCVGLARYESGDRLKMTQ